MIRQNYSYKNNDGLREVVAIDYFRKLWIAQIFSQLGDKFLIILTIFLISENWSSSIPGFIDQPEKAITLLASGIYLANSLPAIFLGAIAGIFADIWPKVRIMIASNLLRTFLAILIPICLIPGPSMNGIAWGYWLLLIIIFLISCLTQLFTPAEQSAIPLIVSNKKLLAANSVYQSTTMGSIIIGFAFGEPLLKTLASTFRSIGILGGEFLLLPICYGAASLILTKLKLNESINPKPEGNIFLELNSGLIVLKKIPTVRRAIIQLVILYCLMASLYILSIGLASSITSLGPTKFGILLAFTGIGIAFGAYLMAQKAYIFKGHKLPTIGLSLIALSLLLLEQSKGLLGFTLAICTLLGLGASLVAIPAQTSVQTNTPEESLGKVLGLQNNLVNIALSLPLLISGALVTQFGITPVLFLLAGLALFGAFFEKSL